MKEIRAIIRPHKLARVREILRALPGFPGMSITPVAGCGASAHHSPQGIREELTDFSDKLRIEIVAPDEMVDLLVDHIVHVTATGQTGDGLVWVSNVERAVFINKTMGS